MEACFEGLARYASRGSIYIKWLDMHHVVSSMTQWGEVLLLPVLHLIDTIVDDFAFVEVASMKHLPHHLRISHHHYLHTTEAERMALQKTLFLFSERA